MPVELQHFEGLFGEKEFISRETKINFESLTVRNALFNYEISEHLHSNLTQIFFMETGGGLLHTEGRQITLKAPCILFVPNGSLHGFSFSENIGGEVLTMATSLFEDCLQGLPDISLYFQDLRHIPFKEDLYSFQELMGTRQRFHAELKEKKVARENIIQLLLQILIVRLYRLVVEHSAIGLPSNNRLLGYYNRFISILKQQPNQTSTVGSCADQLGISPGHLNRVCRELIGKSALQVIHEKLAQEARIRLYSSDHSVSEIAYSLDFRDPSHFSKFFKRQTGISPKRFLAHRKANRNSNDLQE